MRGYLIIASSAVLGLASNCLAGLARRQSIPHDGQYIEANSQNNATEWWWAQVGGPVEDGRGPASFHVTFYQGYPISALREAAGGASAPENYIVINGAFANGTVFAYQIPASSSSVTYQGQAVTGTWAGAGEFKNSADLSKFTVRLNAPEFGVTGTLEITSDGPSHFGCNSTTSPYFDSAIPAGTSLSANEEIFYEQLGWATSQPGGDATVDVVLSGSPLTITGKGYHDANWMPQPIDKFMDDWYFLDAQVGPFDLSAVYAAITGSTKDFNTGFLEHSGTILQNQCSLQGSRKDDFVSITPYGLGFDAPSGVNVMKGFILDYTLANGDQYQFNITGLSLVLDQLIYHRWVGSAVGGHVGGEQYSGVAMYDWLNPSLRPYNG
ncbi:hypothetical protein C8Q70DRAFT_1056491 [Cubamyces menziesii]|uniref:Uncharacterized protein n=1 Tax=Trametes cubensis TaxID=1111947 RepID=A0AAD7XB23_9APHY|nr:hypothetical protein C8Q70DRAFT_1056491 [Cubamyces menziesii]KAJ8481535.1 hypothetical protein ONZ51_g5926 [Trametes cubensis]